MQILQRPFAAILVIALLILIAFAGYALDVPPTDPVRVLFTGDCPSVVFEHRRHLHEEGHALECDECHHDYDADAPPAEMSCRRCHYQDEELVDLCEDQAPHTRCVGANCVACHEDEMESPGCVFCHAR